MWKILGGVFVGVFIGALAVEVIRRTRPELLERIEESATAAATAVTGAFQRGYERREVEDL
jgi:hypothetical protein